MDTQIRGIHHATAMISSVTKIYRFFIDILGMCLIKKTVNQDDIETYHLYFTDGAGAPGTDMTFFDFPNQPKGKKGTDTISHASFRVPSDAALDFWLERFEKYDVAYSVTNERFSKKYTEFEDFDNQYYQLISDENNQGVVADVLQKNSNVPTGFAITGLGSVFVRVSQLGYVRLIFEKILGFKETDHSEDFYLFEIGEGGNGVSIIIGHRTDLPKATEGFGNIHHLALCVADKGALEYWTQVINKIELPNSGFINRLYFQSEYFLTVHHILFELVTDGPGFPEDESVESAGEKLSLPPFLEEHREAIEAYVHPFDTSDTSKKCEQSPYATSFAPIETEKREQNVLHP